MKVVGVQVLDAVPEHDDVVARAAEARMPVVEAHRRVSDEARRRFIKDRT